MTEVCPDDPLIQMAELITRSLVSKPNNSNSKCFVGLVIELVYMHCGLDIT